MRTAGLFVGARRLALALTAVWIGGSVYFAVVEGARDVATLLGGLALIWVPTILIGWIVRGFLGIPMGRDEPR